MMPVTSKEVKVIPGNHDIGDRPTKQTVAKFEKYWNQNNLKPVGWSEDQAFLLQDFTENDPDGDNGQIWGLWMDSQIIWDDTRANEGVEIPWKGAKDPTKLSVSASAQNY